MRSQRYTSPGGRYGALALALGLILALGGVTPGGATHGVRRVASPTAVIHLASSPPKLQFPLPTPTVATSFRRATHHSTRRATATEYALPRGTGPFELVLDAQRNLWFTEFKRGRVAELLAGTQTVREFPLSGPRCRPHGLAVDWRGNVWVTESRGNRVDEVIPYGTRARLTEWLLPRPGSRPDGIALAHDGTVWLSELARRIARLNPWDNTIAEYRIGRSAQPRAIRMGSAGPIFVDGASNTLVSLHLLRAHTARLAWVRIPGQRTDPNDLLVARVGAYVPTYRPNGLVWLQPVWSRARLVRAAVHRLHVRIAIVTASQAWLRPHRYHPIVHVRAMPVQRGAGWEAWKLPHLYSRPYALSLDPSGDRIWMTEDRGNRVAALWLMRRRVLEYRLPHQHSRPHGIAIRRRGPVTQVWVAAYSTDELVVLTSWN